VDSEQEFRKKLIINQNREPPFDRNFLAKELNIQEDQSSKKVPLLYSLLFGLSKEVYEPVYESQIDNRNYNMPNKFKEQSISLNNNNMSSMNKDGKGYFDKKDQPQPWIID